jgi:hypothetical protein
MYDLNQLGVMQQGGLGAYNPPSVFGGFLSSMFGNIGHLGISTCAPDEDGWYDYIKMGPPERKLCQFKQYDDGEPWVGYASDFHPEFNISYLKWKLTGIARTQDEDKWP